MSVVVGHDAIHANISHLPDGQVAGYTTGSADIRWTSSDWDAHPGAVRICQDATASDHTADVLDVETGAATNNEAAAWYKAAAKAYNDGKRPGQRSPAIYTSASNVTPLVNALIGAGIKDGVGLWVANWDLNNAQAVADVENAAGPFPIVAIQYNSGQFHDTDVFSGSWLRRVSETAGPPFRHVTKGASLHDLAASRNVTHATWLTRQAADLTEEDAHEVTWAGPYYTESP